MLNKDTFSRIRALVLVGRFLSIASKLVPNAMELGL